LSSNKGLTQKRTEQNSPECFWAGKWDD